MRPQPGPIWNCSCASSQAFTLARYCSVCQSPATFTTRNGVSRSARETYYARLRALVQRYHFALVEFDGHDEDPAFLYRHQSHLTAKGWVYYNRALDDFFHGRAPRG